MKLTPHQKYLVDKMATHIFAAAIASATGKSTVEHKREAKKFMSRLVDSGVTPIEVKIVVVEIVEEAQALKRDLLKMRSR